jgi:3-oxoacyl-[acyl-carrier-protein] synthase-3
LPATRPGAKGAVITGWGMALPEKVVTNHDLTQTLDTSDEWIVARTGIHQRHIGGTTAGLSIESAQAALEMAGVAPEQIDALILSTTTPDRAWELRRSYRTNSA